MATANGNTTATATKHPLTDWSGDEILTAYLGKLPAVETEEQKQAANAIDDGRYNDVKVFAAIHLTDHYTKALGYLSSVPKVTAAGLPTLPTLLSEAARAIAETLCERAIDNGDLEPEGKENARNIWLHDLNELNRDIFRKALEELN